MFNLGIGMVAVVPPEATAGAVDALRSAGVDARVIGEVVPGAGEVAFSG